MKVDKLDKITLINGDCMEYMRTLPDNAYNLAILLRESKRANHKRTITTNIIQITLNL